MSYRIRQTTNIGTIKKLHKEIFPKDEYYEHSGNIYWLVEDTDTGEYIAFCIATDIGHRLLYLSRVGVSIGHRGKGLHRRLIRVREAYGKRHNFRCVITYTIIHNPNSFSHLVKNGYELYCPENMWAGDDVLYFRKILSKL